VYLARSSGDLFGEEQALLRLTNSRQAYEGVASSALDNGKRVGRSGTYSIETSDESLITSESLSNQFSILLVNREKTIDISFGIRRSACVFVGSSVLSSSVRFGRNGTDATFDRFESSFLDVLLETFSERIESGRDTRKKEVHPLKVCFLFLIEELIRLFELIPSDPKRRLDRERPCERTL